MTREGTPAGGNATSLTLVLSAAEAHMVRGAACREAVAAMMCGLDGARAILSSLSARAGADAGAAALSFRGSDLAEAMLLAAAGAAPEVRGDGDRLEIAVAGRTWRARHSLGRPIAARDLDEVRSALSDGGRVALALDMSEVPALAKACVGGAACAMMECLPGNRAALQGLRARLAGMLPAAVGIGEMLRFSEMLEALRSCIGWEVGVSPRGWSRRGPLFARADGVRWDGHWAGDHAPGGPEAEELREWLSRFPPLDAAYGPPAAAAAPR